MKTKSQTKPRLIKDRVVWCNRGWMPYHFGFCPSEKAWEYELTRLAIKKREPYPVTDASCSYFTNSKQSKACAIVTMSDAPQPGRVKIGMLVHEAMHVWRSIKEEIGEHEASAEFEAYSMQNIVQELIEAYEMTRGRICYGRTT